MSTKTILVDGAKVLFGGLGAGLVVLFVTNYFAKDPGIIHARNLAIENNCSSLTKEEDIARCAVQTLSAFEGANLTIRNLSNSGVNTETMEKNLNEGDIENTWSTINKELPKYQRSLFEHWIDEDNNCIDTRNEKLIQTSLTPPILSDNRCRVISGLWKDPYTGTEFTDPRKLDIDHIVPLTNTWSSGAYLWSKEDRREYANDLTIMYVTSSKENRQKGGKTPDKWLPTDTTFHCEYVKTWSLIKFTNGLTALPEELQAINDIIRNKCN